MYVPQITIIVKCNFPAKEMLVEIEKNISLPALKGMLALKIGIEKQILELYTIYAIPFGQDAIDISSYNAKKGEKIGHHISSNSTVYLAAPAGVRPITKFARKKEEEKEDEKKTVKKKKDINENKTSKFRGITNENCLVWLQASKRRGETEKYETVLEFVDEAITKLFKTINFRRLPKSVLLDLVKRNSLIVNEMELFRAIISWAETRARQILQLKYQEKKEMDKNKIKVKISPQRLKKLLTPFLPFIRFPIMQTREIISIIYPMNLLSQEQIRDLCSFCTIRDEVENSESKNTVLFKKKQAYLDVLSKKNTLKEFIFTHRNGMHVVLWHWDRDYKYELCKTAREAKAIMQSLPGGASRAWYTPYFKVSKKWFCNSTWEKKYYYILQQISQKL